MMNALRTSRIEDSFLQPHNKTDRSADLSAPASPGKSQDNLSLLQRLHRLLNLLLAVVELVLQLPRNLLEQLLREDAQQGPCDVQGGEDVAVLVRPLSQELGLELVREFQVLVLVLAQRLLAD